MTVATLTPVAALAVDAVVKGTILLVLVTIAAQLLRKRSAALRHLIWSLGVVGLVAIPGLVTVMPYRIRVLPATQASQQPSSAEAARKDAASVSYSAGKRAENKTGAASSVAAPAGNRSSAENETAAASSVAAAAENDQPGSFDLAKILFYVWLGGTLAMLLRFGSALLVVRRITTRAREVTDESWLAAADRAARALDVREPLDIRVSDEVAMPFASGLIHPTIVLPSSASDWSAERREAVLKHEIAHLSRGDLAMNTLSHFTRALYWFHPLAWLAAHKIRVEGERACDDAVLRDGSLASEYADHLLSIVRTVGGSIERVPSAALAMARPSEFEGRLLAILEPGVPRGRLTRVRAALTAAAFLIVIMPLAAMSPERRIAESATLLAQNPSAAAKPEAEEVSSNTAVNALIETLRDSSAGVRHAAVQSLGQLGDPRAIAALSKALREDNDARVREAAANALGQIDDARAVPALVEALKAEHVANVRAKIVNALGEIKEPSSIGAVAAIARDPSVQVRREVANALGQFEDQDAVPALLILIKDDDADVRRHAADALGNLKNPSSLDALTAAARDVDADVRRNAVNALGNLEDIKALPAILAALKDMDADVRTHAADAVHQLEGVKKAPQALIDALTDSNRDVRKSVANALGNIGDPAAIPALKRATADGDSEVRRHAVEALAEIGGPEAYSTLVALLKDKDPEIRRIAAEALGQKRH